MKTRLNAVCYASMCFLGIYISVYQNHLNTISSAYSISSTIVGTIVALHFIGSIITPIISGEIGDRIGKKAVVINAFALLNTGLVLLFFFSSIYLFAAGVFLIGCGFSTIEGMLSGVLTDNNREHRSKVIDISQMFFCVGAIAGPLLALGFSEVFTHWKSIYLFLLMMFILIMLVFSFTKVEGPIEEGEKSSGLITIKLFKSKLFIILCISIFLYVGIEEGLAFWTTTYFETKFNAKQLGSYALSGYWGSMVIGRYIASILERKRGKFANWSLIISIFLSIAALLIKNPIVNLICFVGIGFGIASIWPYIISLTSEKHPEYTGTSLGIMMTASSGGGLILPFVMGTMTDAASISAAFVSIPVMSMIILGLLKIVQNSGKKKMYNIIEKVQ